MNPMPMRVLIVEDEIMARQSLARILRQEFSDLRIVGTAGSVRETVDWLRAGENTADVIFMDVELSDGNCFEIFRQVEIAAHVIMTTAYDSYAVRAFEVNSIDYLLKPIDPAALRRAVERCRTSREHLDASRLLDAIGRTREYKQRYIVRFNDRIVPVRTSDIAYFYSEEKNTWLVTADNSRYVMDLSLDILSEELLPHLAQLHRLDGGHYERGEAPGQPPEDPGPAAARFRDDCEPVAGRGFPPLARGRLLTV